MFSENQIDEIRRRLAACGVKDTQLDRAESVEKGDIVAIVRGGSNMAVDAEALASYVEMRVDSASLVTDEEIDAIIDGTYDDGTTDDGGTDDGTAEGCCCEGVPAEEMDEFLDGLDGMI